MQRKAQKWMWSAAGLLALTNGCTSHKDAVPTAPPSNAAQLVTLPNGSFAASPGSVESEMAAFLASNEPAPRTFRLPNEQFSPWSADPAPKTQGTLSTIVLILRAYPAARITLTGYTDNVGPADRNQALSLSRAETLQKLLHAGGIAGNRISVEGKGPSDPIADNGTEQGRAANRRIEITITSK